MKTETHSIDDIINKLVESPLPIEIVPNQMGINLCAVESLTWTKQEDNQLVNITINFKPETLKRGDND